MNSWPRWMVNSMRPIAAPGDAGIAFVSGGRAFGLVMLRVNGLAVVAGVLGLAVTWL
jgi:hypothetical protein